MKGLTKEHVCMTHRHRQQCGGGQREGGGAKSGEKEREEKWGICNSVNNKLKKEKGNWSITIQSGNSDSFPV